LEQRQAALEDWLRFNDVDVAVNRDGRLSRRQHRRLLWSAAWRLVLGPAIAVVAALVAAAYLDTALAVLLALIALCIGLQLSWSGFAFMADATFGRRPVRLRPANGAPAARDVGRRDRPRGGPRAHGLGHRVGQVEAR